MSDSTPTHEVRCELDASNDHIRAKIASAEQMKVHAVLVLGNRDVETNAVSLREHGAKATSAPKPRDDVLADILHSIKYRHA